MSTGSFPKFIVPQDQFNSDFFEEDTTPLTKKLADQLYIAITNGVAESALTVNGNALITGDTTATTIICDTIDSMDLVVTNATVETQDMTGQFNLHVVNNAQMGLLTNTTGSLVFNSEVGGVFGNDGSSWRQLVWLV